MHGYFPSQIPSCFTTEGFAKAATRIRRHISAFSASGAPSPYLQGTRPDPFSVARSRRSRRPVVIPNPIAQLELSYLLASKWKVLDARIRKSALSKSRPVLSHEDGRAIKITSHADLYEERLRLASASRYALLSDISQFFPSLYTHSIAWAVHGKARAKRSRFDKRLLGNKIDTAVQRCQHRQTIGIPIGPDTSHIISELIGASIDTEIMARSLTSIRGYRHVDDFALFYDSLADAELGLAILEMTARSFELKLNPLKTRIIPVAELLEESWSHELQTFEFSPVPAVQRRQLHHFFELAQKIYLQQNDEAVIRYALGRMGAVIVKKQNWDVFQAHILRCAVGFPSTLEDVALLYFTYHKLGYEPDREKLASSIRLIVSEHLPLQHHSELAWSLWIALYFQLEIDCALEREAVIGSGSVTLLLLLELAERRQLRSSIDRRWLRPFSGGENLFDEGWLFTYEAARRGWLPGSTRRNVIASDPLFSSLASNAVAFFAPEREPQPLFKPKRTLNTAFLESDMEIGRDFDYVERRRGYQGAEVLEDSDEDSEDESEDYPWMRGEEVDF